MLYVRSTRSGAREMLKLDLVYSLTFLAKAYMPSPEGMIGRIYRQFFISSPSANAMSCMIHAQPLPVMFLTEAFTIMSCVSGP